VSRKAKSSGRSSGGSDAIERVPARGLPPRPFCAIRFLLVQGIVFPAVISSPGMGLGRKIVLWCGALLIAATGVYPPWLQSRDFGTSALYESRYVYGWIFRPPLPPMDLKTPTQPAPTAAENSPRQTALEELISQAFKDYSVPRYEPQEAWKTELDVRRLAVEWAVICMLVAVCYLTWPPPKKTIASTK